MTDELSLLESLKVPRSFKPKQIGKIVSAQRHCMSNASTWEQERAGKYMCRLFWDRPA